jgi:hypothetical protein
MGVLEAVARIVQLGGEPGLADRVAEMRAHFEARTGAFVPEDPWFEERSRAFWCDALTGARFGREVRSRLSAEDEVWLTPLERAHRGLFRLGAAADSAVPGGARGRRLLVDAWSGAEFEVTHGEDDSLAELDAAAGQLFDARVVAHMAPGHTIEVTLLPGAVFHPRDATAAIGPVLTAARARGLRSQETLDALLRMEHTLRSLSRVKAAYAYRPEALALALGEAAAGGHDTRHLADRDRKPRVRRGTKAPT